MTKRVAILISGGGSNMLALVKSMTEGHPARAVLVLSNNADAAGLQKARDLVLQRPLWITGPLVKTAPGLKPS